MTKDVLVTIEGLQFGDGANEQDLDKIETICPGQFYEPKDSKYVVYEEQVEEIDLPITNRIKIKDNEVTVTKKGPFQVQMVFEAGRKTMTEYSMPFGQIMLGIETQKLQVDETEEEIKIYIKYALEVNYQFVSDCEIKINIQAKKGA